MSTPIEDRIHPSPATLAFHHRRALFPTDTASRETPWQRWEGGPFRVEIVLGPFVPAWPGVAVISGVVVDSETDDPIGDASVTIVLVDDPGGFEVSDVTDVDGEFEFPDLEFGTYDLTVEADGYEPVELEGLVVGNGQHVTVTVSLDEVPVVPGSIAGVVTDSDTDDPIEGADVTTDGAADVTNEDGEYLLDDVAPGVYDVFVAAEGYDPGEVLGVEVGNGQAVTDADVALAPEAE